MIPLQDVIPTGRAPIMTLALITINVLAYAAQSIDPSIAEVVPPLSHAGMTPFVVGVLFLWLFGDNVEARLGRVALAATYAIGSVMGIGAAGGVTSVMGAYFLLLPQSRVLTLVPVPLSLVEVPAAFFLGLWAVLQIIILATTPRDLWLVMVAFAVGAAVSRLLRRPVQWS